MKRYILIVNLIVIVELTAVFVFLFYKGVTNTNLAKNDKDIAAYYALLFSFLLTVIPVYYLGRNVFLLRKGEMEIGHQRAGVHFLLAYGLLLTLFWLSAIDTMDVYSSATIFLIIASILFLAQLTFGGQDVDRQRP